jgi:hypothetical protein
VIPKLETLGHHAIAVDLPSTDPAATLDDYAETVVGAMAGIDGPIVVVAHSAGGATISLVPGRARDDRLVYVTAFVPRAGAFARRRCRRRGPRDDPVGLARRR